MQDESRRRFLVSGGLLASLSLTPLSVRALNAAGSDVSENATTFLSESLRTSLAIITDIIIPATDTPGAIGAGVPEFIERLLARCLPREEAREWHDAFLAFQADTRFNSLTMSDQRRIVKSLDDRLGQDPFYSTIKELTLVGYYTSETGGSIELKYDPIPGPYREIPLKNIDRAWS